MDFTKGHDKPHIGVQTQGRRSDGGSKRFNLTYDGNTHPHRSPKKGEGVKMDINYVCNCKWMNNIKSY